MCRLWTIAAVVFSGVAVTTMAGDLAKIDRTIAKLPALKSDHPEYCLLVFGADLHKRVWLVHDGDVLYVDRNGNGDLTEPDEHIASELDSSWTEDNKYEFKAGGISDGKFEHKDLRVSWFSLDHLKDSDPRVKTLLVQNPKWRGCTVSIDFDMPGQLGNGIGCRVTCEASWQDANGLFQFGASPETAPIINFGGRWQITCYSKEPWHLGGLNELDLAMGTPGIGPGATAFVAYEGVIPPDVKPIVKVTYPPREEGKPSVEKTYELDHRCCGINLYGSIGVPADVGLGIAHVEVSLPNWPGAMVTSTKHEFEIVPARPELKLEPVSWRLKGSLPHVNKGKSHRTSMVQIQFSPDGKRLIAGDYQGGVIQVWNIASGQQLLTLRTGPGSPHDFEYFAVSPDWQRIYAPTIDRQRQREKIEKDGKILNRWNFGDAVQVFNLETGKLLREYQDFPPRGVYFMQLSPDGHHFLTHEDLPGEHDRLQAISFWDVQTGEHRQVFHGIVGISVFSADSKTAVVDCPKSPTDSTHTECLKVLDFPACTERVRITLAEGVVSACPLAFANDEKIIVGSVTTSENRSALTLWDATSGRELGSVPARETSESFGPAKISPDSKTIAIVNSPDADHKGGLYLVDATTYKVRYVDLGAEVIPTTPLFHPSGKWIVAPIILIPKAQRSDSDPAFDELPQPRIQIVDMASATLVETLIAPQSFLNSLAFSPDGNTLATSGPGELLLWDFSTPPGEKRN